MNLLTSLVNKVVEWIDRLFGTGEKVIDQVDDYTELLIYGVLLLAAAKTFTGLGKVVSIKKK